MDTTSFNTYSPEIKKIKTPFAQITARKSGLANRMYYEIQYYNPEDKQFHTGYGSYNAEMVLRWICISRLTGRQNSGWSWSR